MRERFFAARWGADSRMNSLLHTLQPPDYLAGVHARLGQQLSRTQHAITTPADEIDSEDPADDFAVPVTETRTYRPKGQALAALQALRKHGPMTSAGLGRAAGIPVKQVGRLLEIPIEHGLIRRIEGRPVLWELA